MSSAKAVYTPSGPKDKRTLDDRCDSLNIILNVMMVCKTNRCDLP